MVQISYQIKKARDAIVTLSLARDAQFGQMVQCLFTK